VMRQYFAAKEQYPDCLMFCRIGDFYELFYDDAILVARELQLTLTARDREKKQPMCGVPYHAAEAYLQKLLRMGYKIALCEQVEDPAEAKRRGSKSVVKREVVRLVTPGTLTEDSLLEARAANLLVAIGIAGEELALAAADMSAGEFTVGAVAAADLGAELARLGPAGPRHEQPLKRAQHPAQTRFRAVGAAREQREPAMLAGKDFQDPAGIPVRVLMQQISGRKPDATPEWPAPGCPARHSV